MMLPSQEVGAVASQEKNKNYAGQRHKPKHHLLLAVYTKVACYIQPYKGNMHLLDLQEANLVTIREEPC